MDRILAVNFLAFWKLRPKSWGINTLLVPQPKSWGDQSPPVPTVVAPMAVSHDGGARSGIRLNLTPATRYPSSLLCVHVSYRLSPGENGMYPTSQKKQDILLLSISLTNVDQFSKFTSRVCSKRATKWSLKIPPHLKHVATLPRETWTSGN